MSKYLTVVDHPLVQHKLSLMRHVETPSNQFRALLHEIAYLLTYEITRILPLKSRDVQTPLQKMSTNVLGGKKLALVSILRAGNGLLNAVLDIIPLARVGFIGLYRDKITLKSVQYYCKLPTKLEMRPVIILDPMLATGNSSVAAIDLIKANGGSDIRFLCLLASLEGVTRMQQAHPDVSIVTAALDEHLNDKGYIIPGLGDAGDRMFGTN